jgi:hypothetical protein
VVPTLLVYLNQKHSDHLEAGDIPRSGNFTEKVIFLTISHLNLRKFAYRLLFSMTIVDAEKSLQGRFHAHLLHWA